MKGPAKFISIVVSFCAVAALTTATANASDLAADNADNYMSWPDGSNAGFGFGPWSIFPASNTGSNGTFLGDSTLNGASPSGGINSPTQSWGLYANSGAFSSAIRPFTGGPLSIGQIFVVSMDTGFIDSGGTVGFGLQNSAGENLWELFFVGGTDFYRVNDSSGVNDTTLGFTDDGLTVEFTLTGTATYSATITRLEGGSQTITGSLIGQTDMGISQFRAFNANAGGGGSQDAFFNHMAIIPEPSTMALVGLGLLGGLAARRRKK